MNESNAELYDRSASNWQRTEPVLLSDFTARPFLLNWCDPIEGQRVLDLGCGEGYIARQLKKRGAAHVEGIDISQEMIAGAIATQQVEPLDIHYQVGDASQTTGFDDEEFDDFELRPKAPRVAPRLPYSLAGKAPLGDNYDATVVFSERDAVVVELPVLVARSPADF